MATTDSLCFFTPAMSQPGDADYATFDTILTASADEPDHIMLVLDFDPGATEEYIYFVGYMPAHYDGGGLTLAIGWSSDATSGACRWALAFKSITDDADDIDSKAFAAPNTVDATTASAAGEIDYAALTFTDGADMDSVAAGDGYRVKLNRDAANDDATGDGQLVFLELRET